MFNWTEPLPTLLQVLVVKREDCVNEEEEAPGLELPKPWAPPTNKSCKTAVVKWQTLMIVEQAYKQRSPEATQTRRMFVVVVALMLAKRQEQLSSPPWSLSSVDRVDIGERD